MAISKSKLRNLGISTAIAVALVGAWPVAFAQAQQEHRSSAGFLYRVCQENTPSSPQYDTCHAYLYGVIETLRNVKDPAPLMSYCLPDTAHTEDVRLAFNRWSQQHPKAMSLPGPYAVSRALAEAYPCK